MPLKSFLRPRTLDEALAMRESSSAGAAFVAGGTHVVPFGDPRIETFIDLSGLGLDGILFDGTRWRLGATTRLADIARHAGLGDFAGGLLCRTAALWRTSLLRERATIGGVLAGAHAESDLAASLAALGAVVIHADHAGERRTAVESFFRSDGGTNLGSGIVTAVDVPAAGWRAAHERVARTRVDATIVGAAAAANADGWRLALCGVAAHPVLLTEAGPDGARSPATRAPSGITARVEASISPLTDHRASAAYRRRLAGVLSRRVLARLEEAQR